jgi:hypothetical protein
MSTTAIGTDDLVISAVAREEELVRNAVDMVASAGAVSVTVAGLRFGDQLLPLARQLAREAGVQVEPLWTSDETGLDLRVLRSADV